MNAEHRRRIWDNEARFCGYDEADVGMIDAAAPDDHTDPHRPDSYSCECAELCGEVIQLTPPQYEHVRSDLAWFAFGPGHALAAPEHVVEKHRTHWIVDQGAA